MAERHGEAMLRMDMAARQVGGQRRGRPAKAYRLAAAVPCEERWPPECPRPAPA
jgi:hypothetical protein